MPDLIQFRPQRRRIVSGRGDSRLFLCRSCRDRALTLSEVAGRQLRGCPQGCSGRDIVLITPEGGSAA